MIASEAIGRLSKALALLSQPEFDKEEVRALVTGLLDDKHSSYIEQGFSSNDKHLIIHGIMGALSHYEAEQEKENFQKRVRSLAETH